MVKDHGSDYGSDHGPDHGPDHERITDRKNIKKFQNKRNIYLKIVKKGKQKS